MPVNLFIREVDLTTSRGGEKIYVQALPGGECNKNFYSISHTHSHTDKPTPSRKLSGRYTVQGIGYTVHGTWYEEEGISLLIFTLALCDSVSPP